MHVEPQAVEGATRGKGIDEGERGSRAVHHGHGDPRFRATIDDGWIRVWQVRYE